MGSMDLELEKVGGSNVDCTVPVWYDECSSNYHFNASVVPVNLMLDLSINSVAQSTSVCILGYNCLAALTNLFMLLFNFNHGT